RHDIGRGRGGLNKALASSQVPTMVVGVDTDILYPYHQQEHISRNLGNLLAMAKLSSPVGHDAFLVDGRQMDRILRNFIKQTLPRATYAICWRWPTSQPSSSTMLSWSKAARWTAFCAITLSRPCQRVRSLLMVWSFESVMNTSSNLG